MTMIREPAVAGTFYPYDSRELHAMLTGFLAEAGAGNSRPRAIIVPHAGYIYSGPVAASAYARLAVEKDQVHRVVLLGPAHRVPFRGLAASSASTFRTPLGDIPLDRQAIEQLTRLPQVAEFDEAHRLEHSLEVQLPFLQEVLDDFSLVPLVVGDASAEDVAEVLEVFWDDPGTVFVISSDLSHYHDYQTARQLDTRTTRAIEHLQPENIGYDDACGRNPVNGLLLLARHHKLTPRTIDLRNSGDTAGPRDQVVGYGAWIFE